MGVMIKITFTGSVKSALRLQTTPLSTESLSQAIEVNLSDNCVNIQNTLACLHFTFDRKGFVSPIAT